MWKLIVLCTVASLIPVYGERSCGRPGFSDKIYNITKESSRNKAAYEENEIFTYECDQKVVPSFYEIQCKNGTWYRHLDVDKDEKAIVPKCRKF